MGSTWALTDLQILVGRARFETRTWQGFPGEGGKAGVICSNGFKSNWNARLLKVNGLTN